MHVILLIGVDIDKIDCMQLKSIIKKKNYYFLKNHWKVIFLHNLIYFYFFHKQSNKTNL